MLGKKKNFAKRRASDSHRTAATLRKVLSLVSLVASGRRRVHKKKKTRTFLCFCACPGVVLDIREGQPRHPPQTDIFLGGGTLPTAPPPHFCQRRAPLRLTFCWAGGGPPWRGLFDQKRSFSQFENSSLNSELNFQIDTCVFFCFSVFSLFRYFSPFFSFFFFSFFFFGCFFVLFFFPFFPHFFIF